MSGPNYVLANRAAWDQWAGEYFDSGRRDWAAQEPHWGIWSVAEHLPFPDESFDLAISEHGASIGADPYRPLPPAGGSTRAQRGGWGSTPRREPSG